MWCLRRSGLGEVNNNPNFAGLFQQFSREQGSQRDAEANQQKKFSKIIDKDMQILFARTIEFFVFRTEGLMLFESALAFNPICYPVRVFSNLTPFQQTERLIELFLGLVLPEWKLPKFSNLNKLTYYSFFEVLGGCTRMEIRLCEYGLRDINEFGPGSEIWKDLKVKERTEKFLKMREDTKKVKKNVRKTEAMLNDWIDREEGTFLEGDKDAMQIYRDLHGVYEKPRAFKKEAHQWRSRILHTYRKIWKREISKMDRVEREVYRRFLGYDRTKLSTSVVYSTNTVMWWNVVHLLRQSFLCRFETTREWQVKFCFSEDQSLERLKFAVSLSNFYRSEYRKTYRPEKFYFAYALASFLPLCYTRQRIDSEKAMKKLCRGKFSTEILRKWKRLGLNTKGKGQFLQRLRKLVGMKDLLVKFGEERFGGSSGAEMLVKMNSSTSTSRGLPALIVCGNSRSEQRSVNCEVIQKANGNKFKFCSVCRKVYYCSKLCQIDHWKFHRRECKKKQ